MSVGVEVNRDVLLLPLHTPGTERVAGVWMDRERQGGGVRAGVWRGRGLWLGWLDHARSLMRGGVGGVGFRVLSEGRVEGGGWG